MATSSIFADMSIRKPDEIEKFTKAIETAATIKPKKVTLSHKLEELKGDAIDEFFKKK